jgi:hypothetical protein
MTNPDDPLVEAVARAASEVQTDFHEEPLGMNLTRDDLLRIARAIIPIIRDAERDDVVAWLRASSLYAAAMHAAANAHRKDRT